MNISPEIEKFLKRPNFMILSEHNPDGTIHSTIVWYEYEPESNEFRFSTTSDRIKYRNLTQDPRCTFVIPNVENMYQYVQVKGAITDQTKEGGHDFIDKLAKHYLDKETYPYDLEREEDRVPLLFLLRMFLPTVFKAPPLIQDPVV